MPQNAVPIRVPARRGSRGAATHAHDDVSHLTLSEVRDRLQRNERALTTMFGTSPTAATNGAAANGGLSGKPDPARDALMSMREALLAREQELMANGIGSMSMEEKSPIATSPTTRSGKARAMECIRQGEQAHPSSNKMSLPMEQSLALGTRDFDNQTAQRFANLGLQHRQPTPDSEDQREYQELRHQAQASRYARSHVNDPANVFPDRDQYDAAAVYASLEDDPGNGLPMDVARARRDEGYDDDMRMDREEEEDREEEFSEGNDEYEGDGTNTLDAAPGFS